MIRRKFKSILSKIITLLHNSAGVTIEPNCKIGDYVKMTPGFSNGKRGALSLGVNCEFSTGVVVNCYGGSVIIGENVFLGEYVIIYGHGGVEIGENTLIAMHTCIISSNHTVPDKTTLIRSQPDILLPIKIGKDVWIGAGAKILGGVSIGDGCVVGAGAVVAKDLPAYSIAVGIPAKVTGYRND